MQPKRAGNCGWYFKFLNWLSENGLSLDVCGRLCERVTPRSASSSGGFGLHRCTAICVQCELAIWHSVLCNRLIEQWLEQGRTFRIGHTPAGPASAEDVEGDVKIEIRPFRRPHQLGDVPGPDLTLAFRQQLGLLIDAVPQTGSPCTYSVRLSSI